MDVGAIVEIGFAQGPKKLNDGSGKTNYVGMIDRGFTVCVNGSKSLLQCYLFYLDTMHLICYAINDITTLQLDIFLYYVYYIYLSPYMLRPYIRPSSEPFVKKSILNTTTEHSCTLFLLKCP
jgi:hypothetical protein